jgi:hypothetical protein
MALNNEGKSGQRPVLHLNPSEGSLAGPISQYKNGSHQLITDEFTINFNEKVVRYLDRTAIPRLPRVIETETQNR